MKAVPPLIPAKQLELALEVVGSSPATDHHYRGIAQLAEQQAHNLQSIGSNPFPATTISL